MVIVMVIMKRGIVKYHMKMMMMTLLLMITVVIGTMMIMMIKMVMKFMYPPEYLYLNLPSLDPCLPLSDLSSPSSRLFSYPLPYPHPYPLPITLYS